MSGSAYKGESHVFSQVPRADIQRSTFDRSHGHKTTFDEADLVPIYIDEVLPGDTHQVDLTAFARLATPIKPIMDNLYMDFFFFFVPNRLVWSNWQKFCGEQANPGDSVSFIIPTLTTPLTIGYNTVGDYFGIPNYVNTTRKVNALPFRAYNLIWNTWFRDQNLQNSIAVLTGDGPDAISNYPMKQRGKRHDYFTSCLPQPQKGGTPVTIPIGGTAPVRGLYVPTSAQSDAGPAGFDSVGGSIAAATKQFGGVLGNLRVVSSDQVSPPLTPASSTNYPLIYADLSVATSATINALRQSFQVQRMLERDARGGTRYIEILKAHFGVTSPDARLQRPEFLGGGSIPININPVAQTTPLPATGTLTPQGNLSGFGTAAGSGLGFSKSFVEHGYIIGLVSVRPELSYQKGLHRMWSRSSRVEFYWPVFANLGEQAVYTKELYDDGSITDTSLWGYQERWAEYRYMPAKITGKFRSDVTPTNLDLWHLAEKLTAIPTLNDTYITVPKGANAPLYRTLAVPSEPHFLFDSYFSVKSTRPMPLYSVPGLIDHF